MRNNLALWLSRLDNVATFEKTSLSGAVKGWSYWSFNGSILCIFKKLVAKP